MSEQPSYILPEGTERNFGREAQKNNFFAARLVAETIRTTLGPKGMDKLVMDNMGEITVTNDGVTILEEMNIEHPIGKIMVEISKTQEKEVGDGTTTAVVLAGELLKKAEELIEKKIHPTIINKGYRIAKQKAIEELGKKSRKITINDTGILEKIARTAMTGKGAETSKEKLAKIAVEAIKRIKEEGLENIKIEKKIGGSTNDTELIKGVIIDREPLTNIENVQNAKIALLNAGLEIKNTEIDSKITITEPEKMHAFLEQEERLIEEIVTKITRTGANVVFSQKGIDELAQHFLSRKGIYTCRRIKKSDMNKLARATNATIISNINELKKEDLGNGIVKQTKINDENLTWVQSKNPRSVTILIRGGSEHIIDEVERAMDDALGGLESAIKTGSVVTGAGSIEIDISIQLRKYSENFSGKEQLAIQSFAEALEIIPKTLAENAGLDPINVITDLKSKHKEGKMLAGIDVFSGKTVNTWKLGIIEPIMIKKQALNSASEVTNMILRIDDVILSSRKD
jgi:thermosome